MAVIDLTEKWYEKTPFLLLLGRGEDRRPFTDGEAVLASLNGEGQREWIRPVLEGQRPPSGDACYLSFSIGGDSFDFQARFLPAVEGPLLLLERADQVSLSREELDEYERVKTFFQLFKGIIHDVKSKLHFILNNYDYLEESLPEGEDEFSEILREILEDNREGVRSAYDLVREALGYGMDSSRSREPLDLSAVLGKSLSFLSSDMRDIYLEQEFGDAEGAVMGQPEKMERVFVNLLINSIQAFPPGGDDKKIRIEGFPGKGGTYIVRYMDNGPGIKEEVRDRLFTERITTKSSEGGTGLGLIFIKDIVEQDMGGRICLSSRSGDEGAVFRLEFPLADREGS